MKLFAKLKKIWSGFRTTLKFPNCEGGYESAATNFFKLCKEFLCQLLPSNKKWESPSSFLKYSRLKIKYSVFSVAILFSW